MQPITSLLLVIKSHHESAESVGRAMAEWLALRGVTARLEPATPCGEALRQAAQGAHAVVVLGGDGTLVGVARKLVDMRLPILGVNFGKVGFLTEISSQNWQTALARLLKGRLPIVRRLVLHWTTRCQGAVRDQGYAVNDVVIGRGPLARVLPLHVRVDGQSLGWVRSDGLIVSTPTGTTGYAMSAGSSLVHPDVQAMVITSISPFLSRFPSLALPETSVINLEVAADNPEAFLTVDGQDGFALGPGEVITVRGIADGLHLLQPNPFAYYQRLRRCGFIQAAPNTSHDA